MNLRTILPAALVAAAGVISPALKADDTRLELKPMGIIHIDGAAYMGDQRNLMTDGVAMPEARIGVDAKYGDWKVRALVGFANDKVVVRDVYAQYDFTPHNYLRVGNFVHQFGYQNSTAAYDKPTMISPGSETVFNVGQRLGAAFVHTDSVLFFSGSVYAPDDMMNKTLGKSSGKIDRQSLGLKFRSAFHPFTDADKLIAQVGFSALFETPHSEIKDSGTSPANYEKNFTFTLPFPTKVNNVTDESATVNFARNRWQFSPDLLVGYKRLALESQYYYTTVDCHSTKSITGYDLTWPNYTAQGFYVNVRGILIGGNYEYAPALAGLATPAPKTLEAILTYDYTDLYNDYWGSDKNPVHDLALVFNYYINKYMVVRLRGGMTFQRYNPILIGAAQQPDYYEHLGSIQARLQIVF